MGAGDLNDRRPDGDAGGGRGGNLTSRRWIVAKGILFALIVPLAGAGAVLHVDPWMRLALLVICLWAACRFYYFLFHVLERWVGVDGRYAGIVDLARRLWRRRRGRG